ncbi:hypothetical protein DSL72_005151 [Monilinia vaccinii-corymbosi]|uniref:Uncharacterized protein n=1 Tax=Monilinia vaccinii-corymbosi TaxID=61207 RepID=A0A8A3PEU6_9HELO|nr:hypothetical protein DSL72_005151 [Monilinia vaccinii-corymbosi]
MICSSTLQTYLNCGELVPEAIEASADRPGSWGRDALWCKEELTVEVEDGREIGSMGGMMGKMGKVADLDLDSVLPRKAGDDRWAMPDKWVRVWKPWLRLRGVVV